MTLSKRITSRLDSESVRRINEIYHDVENVCYDKRHDEIQGFEQPFWQNVAEMYLAGREAVVCLDYGTGTGFVPGVISQYLKGGDSLICCDVSAEMLEVCKAKLKEMPLECECRFHAIEGDRIPADSDSVDIVTVNSVLHHMFNLSDFASECARILKPSGLLVVSHEPHRPAITPYTSRFLLAMAEVAFRPKRILFRVVERFPFAEGFLRSILGKISTGYRQRNTMLTEIAKRIRSEGILDFDLKGTEVQQIVDFQAQEGFDRQELVNGIFKNFEVIKFETYCHLGFFTRNRFAASVDRYFHRRWPDTGKELRFILRKL